MTQRSFERLAQIARGIRRSEPAALRVAVCLAIFACVAVIGGATAIEAQQHTPGVAVAAPVALVAERVLVAVPPAAGTEVAAVAPPEAEHRRATVPEPPPAPRADEVFVGQIRAGQTLAASLQRQAIDSATIHRITQEMAPVFNFRYARAGDRYRLERLEDGRLLRFVYERSELERYVLQRNGDQFIATRDEPEILRRTARVAGLVQTSLYEAIADLGAEPTLASDFSEIFAWDVDFSRSVRSGDEFSILYERLFLEPEGEDERSVGPGRVLAARYTTRDKEFRAVYFETAAGRGGYYRPDGTAVERQFLKAPLHYRRISSAYTLSRLHPILKVRRPHQGIDYAAPHGTQVWSVADGEVIFRGRMGGFGNLVKVRHANGYVSYYGHLSRFARNLRVGSRVSQKQVIGYVGSTGLATGPHLDYRLKKNGRYVNPATLRMPAGDPIPDPTLPVFAARRDELLAELDPRPLVSATGAL